MKLKTYILSFAMAGSLATVVSSCDDMLDKGNDYVIYADDHVLVNPADTVTSVMGILNKLQGIAVRTNLLGEVRADLVKVNSNATSDLKDLAELSVSDDNEYNVPRDYYAVINNCNYYLANVDSTAGNSNRNEKYFEAEIAQVHSIRAWTYLQLVLVYGKVPLVTEPVITKLQSEATYETADLNRICDYFINDLQSYYGKQYPDYGNITDQLGIDPQMCFFPTQVVMGDLYLWRAAANHNAADAKQAAKCYYDYIKWDLNDKNLLRTGLDRVYWEPYSLYSGQYKNYSQTYTLSSTWGGKLNTDITKIPMDSASADGYYNELRNLYNTTMVTEVKEASISPSDQLKTLSQSQTYVGYDSQKNIVEVTADRFTDEDVKEGLLGDLRYASNYSEKTTKYNNKEYDFQAISKHSSQHISVYRASQLYLRLAEALNYAGYPRFARQILTMGLSNTVIAGEVSPYYTTASDSAFISYFDFNNSDFVTYVTSYNTLTAANGRVVKQYIPVYGSLSDEDNVDMWGVHSKGSGLPFLNSKYAPLAEVDSTSYPFVEEQACAVAPVEPTVVKKPADKALTFEEWCKIAKGTKDEAHYNSNYYNKWVDSVANYTQYEADLAQYEADVVSYAEKCDAFVTAFNAWRADAYGDASFIETEQKTVDQAILDEQALEMVYEGNRYYDLMRRAYWWGDNSRLVAPISKRTSSASKLNDRSNWFLNWKGQIGY